MTEYEALLTDWCFEVTFKTWQVLKNQQSVVYEVWRERSETCVWWGLQQIACQPLSTYNLPFTVSWFSDFSWTLYATALSICHNLLQWPLSVCNSFITFNLCALQVGLLISVLQCESAVLSWSATHTRILWLIHKVSAWVLNSKTSIWLNVSIWLSSCQWKLVIHSASQHWGLKAQKMLKIMFTVLNIDGCLMMTFRFLIDWASSHSQWWEEQWPLFISWETARSCWRSTEVITCSINFQLQQWKSWQCCQTSHLKGLQQRFHFWSKTRWRQV